MDHTTTADTSPPPTTPDPPDTATRALDILQRITGRSDVEFRSGQLEAIRTIVDERRRALVVQRTGWGKSAVYFIATRLLRDAGAGPTVIVSPLLALMRNQVEMAERAGICAHTVNSANRDEWDEIFGRVKDGTVDLLLISPERLNNPQFVSQILPDLLPTLGLLVIDEVHCISDWGHDFRPDYRRLQRVVASLPIGIPVLGTTATANDRVIEDVEAQLGNDLVVIRGTLERDGLSLQVIDMPNKANRMAWLSTTIPDLPGSGIVYCLTISDAERVGAFLRDSGIDAGTYTGRTPDDERVRLEARLSAGEMKVVVATSALGMGYDNPRIHFVIHFQVPGSPIAYYQQVGRAGRAIDRSYGVALSGWEDRDIQSHFIETAFPSETVTNEILTALETSGGLRIRGGLEAVVNLRQTRIATMLKVLEVEGAVYREGTTWFRSDQPWTYPTDRIAKVTAARRTEQQAMSEYVVTTTCLMQFLRGQLDDPVDTPCGICSACSDDVLATGVDTATADAALGKLRGERIVIAPRLQKPPGLDAELSLRSHNYKGGRALTRQGDPGIAELVRDGLRDGGTFDDAVVEAATTLVRTWQPDPAPRWVASVPSGSGNPALHDLATRLARRLELPLVDAVTIGRDHAPQSSMENSYQQAANAIASYEVIHGSVPPGPVLLVDDIVDSRWTATVVAHSLRSAGSGEVHLLALSEATAGGG